MKNIFYINLFKLHCVLTHWNLIGGSGDIGHWKEANLDSAKMQGYADHPKLKRSVFITGTAKESRAGPAIGLLDIGVSDSAYLFRVVLSGVRKDQSKVPIFCCF